MGGHKGRKKYHRRSQVHWKHQLHKKASSTSTSASASASDLELSSAAETTEKEKPTIVSTAASAVTWPMRCCLGISSRAVSSVVSVMSSGVEYGLDQLYPSAKTYKIQLEEAREEMSRMAAENLRLRRERLDSERRNSDKSTTPTVEVTAAAPPPPPPPPPPVLKLEPVKLIINRSGRTLRPINNGAKPVVSLQDIKGVKLRKISRRSGSGKHTKGDDENGVTEARRSLRLKAPKTSDVVVLLAREATSKKAGLRRASGQRSPGGTPCKASRNSGDGVGDGLTPMMTMALRRKFTRAMRSPSPIHVR